MCVQCEDCKFANWEAALFCDSEEGHWEGNYYVEPYSEQFDFYCNKHERFYLEEEITGCCRDGISGPNNYHEVCIKHYREIADLKEELKKKRYYKEYDVFSIGRGAYQVHEADGKY